MDLISLDLEVPRVDHGARLFRDEDNFASFRILRQQ
jgi:hypothetical protein